MQPHFLFNTLNSIAALVHDDPEGAERITGQLAALLRSALDSTATPLVTLDEELRVVARISTFELACASAIAPATRSSSDDRTARPPCPAAGGADDGGKQRQVRGVAEPGGRNHPATSPAAADGHVAGMHG